MIETVNSTSSVGLVSTTSSVQNSANSSGGSQFAQILETATTSSASSSTSGAASKSNAAHGRADFMSGQLGIELSETGIPMNVLYFDQNGELLTSSNFNAANILKFTHEFGIPLSDLKGLGEQMDAAGIGYRPYELYSGTGSNHGIDFDNLIAGGLGTAYDWREDPLASMKGTGAVQRLEENRKLAQELGLSSILATPRNLATASTASPSTTNATATTSTGTTTSTGSTAAAESTTGAATATTAALAAAVDDSASTGSDADVQEAVSSFAEVVSEAISEALDHLQEELASVSESISSATAQATAGDGASVSLSESQQNELLQLVNSLQQPALRQHLLAVLEAGLAKAA